LQHLRRVVRQDARCARVGLLHAEDRAVHRQAFVDQVPIAADLQVIGLLRLDAVLAVLYDNPSNDGLSDVA